MVSIKDNTITITRGDTLETNLIVKTMSGADYVPTEGDVIRFALKGSYDDDRPIINKVIPNDSLILRLEASETKQLEARRKPYVYDVELRTPEDTVVDTFLTGEMYVTQEVY
ncbi:MAG: hypothetical protein IJ198_11810 [Lachnospiraceae bacterium]|nr:hypothetical protein [Lachnospiraceae bacterium]